MRRLLLALLLPTLVGCSATELVYRNADWLIERWADRLLDLSRDQKAWWRLELEPMLARHREVELPMVTGFLGEFEQKAEEGLTEQVLTCLAERADELFRAHARLAAELAAPLLAQLTDEQIRHLAAELRERNSEYREEYLAEQIERRTADRGERVLERIERWTGPLQSAQREMVTLAGREMPDLAAAWLEYRLDRQQRLLALLRQGAGEAELGRFLEAWWVDLAERPPDLVVAVDAVRNDTIALLSRLDRTLTAEQRQELVERVARLRGALEDAGGGGVAVEGSPCLAARTTRARPAELDRVVPRAAEMRSAVYQIVSPP